MLSNGGDSDYQVKAIIFNYRLSEERGASMIEYVSLVALLAVVCLAAVTSVGIAGANVFKKAGTSMENGGGTEMTDGGDLGVLNPDRPQIGDRD